MPAEIWRRNNFQVEKVIPTRKEIRFITLDPHLETADVDLSNNAWPRKPVRTKFQDLKEDRDKNNVVRELNEEKKTSPPSGGGRP